MNKVTAFDINHKQKVHGSRSITLGMAELQPDGISEQWFLKLGGDVHWTLIAQAMGQKHAVFEDAFGREVYAAFCATSLEVTPNRNLLAEDVELKSSLYQIGFHQIGSIHEIYLSGIRIATLSMISTFVSHGADGSNRSIVRNKHMPRLALETAPQKLNILAGHARAISRHNAFDIGSNLQGTAVRPCRTLDFNAVGLLYFPTFSKFAESYEYQIEDSVPPLLRRDVIYLGNVDFDASLNIMSSGSDIFIQRDDGKLIAMISTKRCVG